jgi:hypothetical protein
MAPQAGHRCVRATLLRVLICFAALGASQARAADLAVTGHLGYMSEWEISATARTIGAGRGGEFTGPLVIKHLAPCMPDETAEKSGEIRFRRTGLLSSWIEGELTFDKERCTFKAREGTDEGIMNCPDKGGVPLTLKIQKN